MHSKPELEAPAAHLSAASAQKARLTKVLRTGPFELTGYCVDLSEPTQRFVLELTLDGIPAHVMRADLYHHELAEKGIGDARYGFVFALRPEVVGSCRYVEIRIANTGERLAAALDLAETPIRSQTHRAPGRARWLGGLRIAGSVPKSEAAPVVEAWIDGAIVATAVADHWVEEETGAPAHGFDLWLPPHLADARFRKVHIYSDGKLLAGSPMPVIAFPDGLRQLLLDLGDGVGEAERGRLLDQLLPQAMPFSEFEAWSERYPITKAPPQGPRGGMAIAIVGEVDLDVTLAPLQHERDWVAGVIPAQGSRTRFSREHFIEFLRTEAAQCELVLVALSGTALQSGGLEAVRAALDQDERATLAYTDVLLRRDDRVWPLAYPAFDYERTLEQGYGALFFAIRREAALKALIAGADNVYRLFNMQLDGPSADLIPPLHVPAFAALLPSLGAMEAGKVLAEASAAHLRSCGIAGDVRVEDHVTLPSIRVLRQVTNTSTTVIIPAGPSAARLSACVASLSETLRGQHSEILVIDTGAGDPKLVTALLALRRNGTRVHRMAGAYNKARVINNAARIARGEFLCLLDPSLEAIDAHWLHEMMSRCIAPDVGAVGAGILSAGRIVRQAGLVLGPQLGTAPAFRGHSEDEKGYGGLLTVAHECSAVSASCLMTKRSDFVAVGGMDEINFSLWFYDVDYCLKLRAGGKRIVVTPRARVIAGQSDSNDTARGEHAARRARELSLLRAKWGHVLAADPSYNPNLSLDPSPFTGLAWPPRSRTPRSPTIAPPTRVSIGF